MTAKADTSTPARVTVHRISLDPAVPADQSGELSRRIYFVSPDIVDFELVWSGEQIAAVDLTLGEHADVAAVARKLRFVVANDVLGLLPYEPKIVWQQRPARPPRDVFDDLLALGIASGSGEGQVSVGQPVLALMDYLDTRFCQLAVGELGAREFRYPTLIPTAVLRRCSYFQSFPQLIMFVSRLHGDVDTYRRFIDTEASGEDLTERLRADCADFEYSLPPTMCFHTFHQLADKRLHAPSYVVTSRGKSFRHESRYRRSLERLWDFTIREVVFFGSRDFVLGARARLMELTFALAQELGLGGRCEVANDPFFVHPGAAERTWSQQLLELKYELRLPLEGDRDVAVCSFNFHEKFFADSFGIMPPGDGETLYTACAGYGLERFAFAFLCQHGLDQDRWPAEVRKLVAAP
jgi:seryl-tRNA synthetase